MKYKGSWASIFHSNKTAKEIWSKFVSDNMAILAKNHSFLDGYKILFGVAENGQGLLLEALKYNITFDAVIDNDKAIIDTKWMNLDIFLPDDVLSPFRDDVRIIICGGSVKEKERQLIDMGYRKDIHYFIIAIEDQNFINQSLLLLNGYRTFKKIKKETGSDVFFYCPYPGTGDAYITGMYLKQYVERHSKGHSYKIVVVGNAFKKIMELFGITEVYVINKVQRDRLNVLLNFVNGDDFNIHFMLFWGLKYQNAFHLEIHNNTNFHDFFRKSVFLCDSESKMLPEWNLQNSEIETFFSTKGLIEKKTVILAPYAYSFVEELTQNWWEKLAAQLSRIGYVVCTNSAGKNEPVIKGTIPVFFEFKDAKVFLEKAGYFIGVRSGLCDVISSVQCKKIIIYQDFMRQEKVEYFSLKRMKLCDDAIEYKLNLFDHGAECLGDSIIETMQTLYKK